MKDIIQIIIFIYLIGHPEYGRTLEVVVSPTVNAAEKTINKPIVTNTIPVSENMVVLVNIERSKEGLRLLKINNKLNASALAKCKDMVTNNYWAHISPNGTEPWKFILDAGYRFYYAGENLIRFYPNDQEAMKGFMGSPTHRRNVLNPNYKDIGIGRCVNMIVQHFGSL